MKKILIVDDDQGIREMLAEFLKEFGYEVTEAKNGKQGLEMLQKEEFDLVITDIGMPYLRGDQMIKNYQGQALFIVMSGAANDQELAKIIKTNDPRVKYFLPKPFSLADLLRSIKLAFKSS